MTGTNSTAQQQSVTHNTFVIERTYPVPAERVFRAFTDPTRKRRWFIEGDGTEIEQFELDFRVGGHERARFRFKPGVPVAGLVCSTETWFQEIVPNQRILSASTMAIAGRTISASLVTFELAANGGGTALILTHQGAFLEGSGGPEMREDGWKKLLGRLADELAS